MPTRAPSLSPTPEHGWKPMIELETPHTGQVEQGFLVLAGIKQCFNLHCHGSLSFPSLVSVKFLKNKSHNVSCSALNSQLPIFCHTRTRSYGENRKRSSKSLETCQVVSKRPLNRPTHLYAVTSPNAGDKKQPLP